MDLKATALYVSDPCRCYLNSLILLKTGRRRTRLPSWDMDSGREGQVDWNGNVMPHHAMACRVVSCRVVDRPARVHASAAGTTTVVFAVVVQWVIRPSPRVSYALRSRHRPPVTPVSRSSRCCASGAPRLSSCFCRAAALPRAAPQPNPPQERAASAIALADDFPAPRCCGMTRRAHKRNAIYGFIFTVRAGV